MASRWIPVILWTLVGVNMLTLVAGGLITWLGYAIPVRLKQFGLSPELAIAGGFASLLVACLGLCALNYSSHYALNIYGLSCTIFILLMLPGILPDTWYGNSTVELHHSQHQLQKQAPSAQERHVATGGAQSGLILDLIYYLLVLLLLILLSFAFTLAQYLRRKETEENNFNNQLDCSVGLQNSSLDCTCGYADEQANHSSSSILGTNFQHDSNHNFANNSNLFANKDNWLSAMRHANQHNNDNTNQLGRVNLKCTNNNKNANSNQQSSCRLANFLPLLHRNNNTCCHVAAPSNKHDNDLTVLQCAPLMHKGFYRMPNRTGTEDNSASGCSQRPQNDDNRTESGANSDHDGSTQIDGETRYKNLPLDSKQSMEANSRKLSTHNPYSVSRDDTLVHYGRQQQSFRPLELENLIPACHNHHRHNRHHLHHRHNQRLPLTGTAYPYQLIATGTCECNMASSAASLVANLDSSPMARNIYDKHHNNLAKSHHTIPRLNSTSTYAIKGQGQSIARPRRSGSSVMVVTTAAPAVGDVADSSYLGGRSSNPDADNADPFNDHTTGSDDIKNQDATACEFDDNDNELIQAILNTPPNSTFYQSLCDKPNRDYAPLLDFKK